MLSTWTITIISGFECHSPGIIYLEEPTTTTVSYLSMQVNGWTGYRLQGTGSIPHLKIFSLLKMTHTSIGGNS